MTAVPIPSSPPIPSISARPWLHPLHALLLAFPIALFTAALVADIAYLRTAEMQWSNFASWAIAGALLFGAPVLLWAMASFLRQRRWPGRRASNYLALVGAMWLLGLVNAFRRSGDAWSSVGTVGLALSIVCTVLALVAGWIGLSGTRVTQPQRSTQETRRTYTRRHAQGTVQTEGTRRSDGLRSPEFA